jgi:hypothetical protein
MEPSTETGLGGSRKPFHQSLCCSRQPHGITGHKKAGEEVSRAPLSLPSKPTAQRLVFKGKMGFQPEELYIELGLYRELSLWTSDQSFKSCV